MERRYMPRVPKFRMTSIILALLTLTSLTRAQAPTPPVGTQLAKAAESPQEGLFYLWNVQTKKTVGDNFGHYIADRYYVVELLLNNQYEQKVIITGVGFNTRQDAEEVAIAATDPQTIKGILLKKDLIGRNARFKNVIKATRIAAYRGPAAFSRM